MTWPLFPKFAGIGWDRPKRPSFNSSVSTHTSGDEVRVVNMAYPIWEWELPFPDYIPDDSTPNSDYKTFLGFILQLQGQAGVFRYSDPSDNAVTGQELGAGDGTTSTFFFARTLGGFNEPVGYVEQIGAIYVNGVKTTTGWTLASSVRGLNALTFAAPPASGAIISADFAYSFLCRLSDDTQEFVQHLPTTWMMKSFKFKSVKRP